MRFIIWQPLRWSDLINFGFKILYEGIFRGVAQPGRALRSGRRGRRFKSYHPDHFNFSKPFAFRREAQVVSKGVYSDT